MAPVPHARISLSASGIRGRRGQEGCGWVAWRHWGIGSTQCTVFFFLSFDVIGLAKTLLLRFDKLVAVEDVEVLDSACVAAAAPAAAGLGVRLYVLAFSEMLCTLLYSEAGGKQTFSHFRENS